MQVQVLPGELSVHLSFAKIPSAEQVVDLSVLIRHNPRSMITLLLHLLRLLPFLCGGHHQLALENLALCQQLAVYRRTTTRPKLRTTGSFPVQTLLTFFGLPRASAAFNRVV